ncbi:MAG: hypothetical protein IPP37_10415 [Saprospiraceae bacterium]|nr:hypothetical protein [Saprospiraceae bacterium]MBL0082807.1 hypothetical protein [Saprospiraceae bacterium]
MEKNNWHCLLFTGNRNTICDADLLASLSALGEVTQINLQHQSSGLDEMIATWDVTKLQDLLHQKDAVVYVPDVPAWKTSLDSLVENELKELTCVLNAAQTEGLSNFIFVSDIEGMGAAPRPVAIDENSLWSGQTNANDVQKYWYLCEQECRRAAEEGLNVLIIAAARMPKDPALPRTHVYATSCLSLANSIQKSLVKQTNLQKIFVLQQVDQAIPSGFKEVKYPKWMFWKKTTPINSVYFDYTSSNLFLSQD